MNDTCSIPETIREDLAPMPAIDEHPEFFARPTRPILGSDYSERIAAVRCVSFGSADAIAVNPAYLFALEAQLDGLEDVLDRISQRNPERFREIERGRDLLENLQILLAGGPTQ